LTSDQFLEKIMVVFDGKYPGAYQDEIRRAVANVTEESLNRVYLHLRDTVDRSGRLVFAKLRGSIQACGEFIKRERVKPDSRRVTCALCGESFDYNIGADRDDWLRFGISALCPGCGWPHADTEHAERWAMARPGKTAADLIAPRLEQHKRIYKDKVKAPRFYSRDANERAPVPIARTVNPLVDAKNYGRQKELTE
jgi:hypothetical protein